MYSHGMNLGVKLWLHSKKFDLPVLVWEDQHSKHFNKIIIENLDGTDRKEYPMRSFVGAWMMRLMRCLNDGIIYFNANLPNPGDLAGYPKHKDGTTDFTVSGSGYGIAKLAGTNTTGIQVGYVGGGAPAVTHRDYTLSGLIAHGNGAGNLYKNAMQGPELGLDSFGASHSEFVIERIFTNNSGSDIDINESAIYINYAFSWDSAWSASYMADNKTVMVVRDTFPTVTISNGTGKRVRYVFSLDAVGSIGFNNNFIKNIAKSGGLGNRSVSNDFTPIVGVANSNSPWTISYIPTSSTNPNAKGYEGQIYAGLALSTGSDVFDLNKFTFTPITHGSTSGKLFYNDDDAAVSAYANPIDGTKTTRNFKRRFDNFSGGSITVNSLGWLCSTAPGIAANRFMIAYALINGGSGVVIANGDSLIVEAVVSADTVGV